MRSEIILANIRTMDSTRPLAGAVFYEGGVIRAVGDADALRAEHPEAAVRDCRGMTLLPGFLDTHVHAVAAGLLRGGADLSPAKSIPETLGILRARDAEMPEGQWLFAGHYQDKRVAEKRMPTREELDSVSVSRPIFVYHNDCHPYSFNTEAIRRLGLKAGVPGIGTDDGITPNGIVEDPACADVEKAFYDLLDPGSFADAYRLTEREAVRGGVTTIFAKEYLRTLRALLPERDSFLTTLKPMMRTPGGCGDVTELEALIRDPALNEGTTVCTFLDGAFDGWSAANFEPYLGQPENYGMLYSSDEELYRFFDLAMSHGLQVSAHAIGDRAVEQYLRVMARLAPKHDLKAGRPRIEHFEMPNPYQIERAAEMGVALGMQPLLIEVCEGMDFSGYAPYIGSRVTRCSPYRSCLEAGCLVGGGSDHPVTDIDPLHAVSVAMRNPVEAERISAEEGLRMFTCDAARIGFLEDRKGMIREGLDADFVLLSGDPFCEDISGIRVEETIAMGRTVWSREDDTL